MHKVIIYAILLMVGLVMSQLLPSIIDHYSAFQPTLLVMTMVALSYIMINVGREFEIDKNNIKQYGWDYIVAMTAATFPWIGVVAYFLFVLFPQSMWASSAVWKELFVLGRFVAPTSAGVLFAMLAAAGLSATWVFAKARVLAIFDDLDTVLLMIPLSLLIVGWNPAMALTLLIMLALLVLGYRYLHRWAIPAGAVPIVIYSVVIASLCELFYLTTKVHFEVLLPAFVLGCVMKSQHESKRDATISTLVAGAFMVLVGLSMPVIFGEAAVDKEVTSVMATLPAMTFNEIIGHVLIISVIANLGKMFPLLCYRKEASLRERFALSVAMFPRGEVGAGVVMISLGYGFGGPIITIAILALALNLALTGVFIWVVRMLIEPEMENAPIKTRI